MSQFHWSDPTALAAAGSADTSDDIGMALYCMTACLASIFECAYEDAPVLCDFATGEPVEQWLRVMTLWLHERGFHPQNMHHTKGDRPQSSPWHWPTVWMAGVASPRYNEPSGEPGLHCVVMQGSDLVWDPHPQRDMGHLGFIDAELFLPRDPARLVLSGSADTTEGR